MKKRKGLIITIISVCIFATGITAFVLYHKTNPYMGESPFKEVDKWDFVYMEEPEMLEHGMNIKMYFDTDKTIFDNLFYYIEEKGKDGKWYTIPFKEDIDEDELKIRGKGMLMPCHEENPYGEDALYYGSSVRYQEYYDLLPKGEYRILIPLFYSDGLKQERDYRSVEFTLEHDMGEHEEQLYIDEIEAEKERMREFEERTEEIGYEEEYTGKIVHNGKIIGDKK